MTMTKPLLFWSAILCALVSDAQKVDTLVFFYKSDQYALTLPNRQQLDSFLRQGWDRISINGFTDETDAEDYNMELSKKRSGEVYQYLLNRKFPVNTLAMQYFGETAPKADNESEEGRALNRRTEIIGYRFAKPRVIPIVDMNKPVTRTLDNGFIITYKPGHLPPFLLDNFESGSGMNFQLVTNTEQMRQSNLYTNTTNGEILSSVLVFCGVRMDPCKLDSPILLKIPVNIPVKCPVSKVIFFNTVVENGNRLWQEQARPLYPEVINGQQYISVWIDDFCSCINFDFKVEPGCFDVDSAQLYLVNAKLRNLTVELQGMNSVYIPNKVNDSTFLVIYQNESRRRSPISFTLYSGKRRIRSFRDQNLSDLVYDEPTHRYRVQVDTVRLAFPKLNVYDVALRVNKDKYRTVPEKTTYEFLYLNRPSEAINVDFSIQDRKGRLVVRVKNRPLSTLPFDAEKGCYVIDRELVKQIRKEQEVAKL
jgi:hypothetical protein